MSNRLNQLVTKVNGSNIPDFAKKTVLSFMFNSQVKYAMTSGILVESLSPVEATMQLKNKWRVQNHIGGVHACGMALLAESTTGIVFGLNVPDTHLPLLKSMKIDYKQRAIGDLSATATLSKEQIDLIHNTDRGDVTVPVRVTDSTGNSPIECEMTWAWIAKKKNTVKA